MASRQTILSSTAMPRAQKATGKSRHDPLIVQLGEDELNAKFGKVSQPGRRKTKKNADLDENAEVRVSCISISPLRLAQITLDSKTSTRIFELARDQQEELAEPDDFPDDELEESAFNVPRMTVEDDEDDDEIENADEHDVDAEEELVCHLLS